MHENLEILVSVKKKLVKWLGNTSRLILSDEQTKFVQSTNGFQYLGYSFMHVLQHGTTKIKIYPSKQSQKELISVVGDICRKFRSISTFNLIGLIKPKILIWANYFKCVGCKKLFHKIDYKIFQILSSWVFRRDRKNSRSVVKEKYFPSGKTYNFRGYEYKDNWILCAKYKLTGSRAIESWIPRVAWVFLIKYIKANSSKSVYHDDIYWIKRIIKYSFNLLK
jgi:hypothetical protein